MNDHPEPDRLKIHPDEMLPKEIDFDFEPARPPRNITGMVMAKLAVTGMTMVFLSACIWAVAYILSNLPTR